MNEPLQAGKAFALSMLAGFIAGGILAGINVAVVQPYTIVLADNELENQLAEDEFNEMEYDDQLQSIYFSQLYGSIIVGLVSGTLIGVVFLIGKIGLSPFKTALLIAGIAWFVLYVVPSVKYPPSVEAMFEPEMAASYQTLLAGYTGVSGLSALAVAYGFRKIKTRQKVYGATALYLAVVAGAFFVFPDFKSEDDPFLPQPILNTWRSAIALSITAFWFSLGIICGLFWSSGIKKHQNNVR
jgi:putative cobalt transporter subunit CbtA